MNIVFISNPDFFGSSKRPGFSSMPRFTGMLADGMAKRGHRVEVWTPAAVFFGLPTGRLLKKWMGYVDQYILFPAEVKRRLKKYSDDTLFVFTDQAQGPWVPLLANRPHVIHCHDLLAQQAALGRIPGCRTGWTGRQYQHYIRRGLIRGKHFISVSDNTEKDLKQLLPGTSASFSIVYNAVDSTFRPFSATEARRALEKLTGLNLRPGYCLHVGNNQWYKNRQGVIEIYEAWRKMSSNTLPLLMIGAPASQPLSELLALSPFKNDVHFIQGLSDDQVRLAYAGASVFIFPSLAEGFGWPLAEAMATGCPVMTTNKAPMTEVAGNAGFLIAPRPQSDTKAWATDAARLLQKILDLSETELDKVRADSVNNATRFDLRNTLDQIEKIYQKIINTSRYIPMLAANMLFI